MKIKINRKPHGIVLAVTLGIILIFAIIVAAYVTLVNNQNSAVWRSQSWNQAIPVLETGIEEGLTQLYLYGTNGSLLTNNSWTFGADGLFHKARTNYDGSYYTASLQITNYPVIISTGVVPVIGISGNVTRRVKVVTTPLAPTQGGVSAKTTITFSGRNPVINSFNSSNPLYSSNGQYVASLAESNAVVVADSSSSGAISTGNATIDGSAIVGPGGTLTGNAPTGGWTDNANVQFNDVAAPFTYGTGSTPSGGTYQGTNYSAVLGTGNYNVGSLSSSLAVEADANAVLYVNGNINITGTSVIYIAPGASLAIYDNNGSVSIKGGGIVNSTMLASQCSVYGMPNCTGVDLAGNGNFIGTVYAPDANVTVTGNGDVIGALVGDSIEIKGNGSIHFDQALTPAATNYVVSSWNEF